jgi:NAD-dependent SIR2 family protein deacetylase
MHDVDALTALCDQKRLAVLTGAGCSTESGIPDYRGPGTRSRARNPMSWKDFASSPDARRRYWARAAIGWERFSRAAPNAGHHALARLERGGVLTGLVTQNVDRLHHAAGSERVVELHGALAETRCTDCGVRDGRERVQSRIVEANPGFLDRGARSLPDGDSDLDDEAVRAFVPPECVVCGGTIRPDVVFFGENVPRPTVDAAFAIVDAADVLLVVGSSLAVFSGFRFVRRAVELRKPVAIVNLGPCRGEEHATVRVHGRSGEVLAALSRSLTASSGEQSRSII